MQANLPSQYLSAIQELNSLRDFLRFAQTEFYREKIYLGHGVDNFWDEALLLIAHVLHLPPMIDARLLDATLLTDEKKLVAELIWQRVSTKKPSAYLTHEAWFMQMPFYVDERVLIPRSPMAELLENHLQPWIGDVEPKNILDLCTGSGCIAIAASHIFPHANVIASDISQDCLDVALVNCQKHQVENRIQLIQSDLFANLYNQKFDIILSNPPYVSETSFKQLPKEYQHEPKLALVTENDGLEIPLKILKQAANYLNKNGFLFLEVGESQEKLEMAFPDFDFTWCEFANGGEGVLVISYDELVKL